MKKTKIVVGVLSLIMAFTLIGCGNNDKNQTDVENNNEIIISGENNDENLEQSETGVKIAEELKIPFELKEENIVEENFEYEYHYFNKSKKIIEYSLEHEMLNGPIYFGRSEGIYEERGDKHTVYFIEYNNEIVATYEDEDKEPNAFNWKEAILLMDLNENDDYIEMNVYSACYRIGKNEFIHMGYISGELINFDKEKNRICSTDSYIGFIEEKVLTNYYEIVDNKLVHVCKFEDGRVSVTDWEHEGDFSELSKNEYTVAVPVYIWDLEEDATSSTGYKMLEVGEKIKILEIKDLFWGDAKVQRANGEIVDVTMVIGNRT
ncbi:MAG: hypothetical protein IKK43_01165 [Clostridia bacterium]|nr:hypothetical protein [Clostridia bacterium]